MRTRFKVAVMMAAVLFMAASLFINPNSDRTAHAQVAGSPTPITPFDQAAAIAKLKEQIKGRENEPSTAVFKNIQTPMLKGVPAGRVLAVMELGFSRSLGVNCSHCHVPDRWDVEDKPQKQIARDMAAMVATINKDLLSNVKNLKSATPTINCTTCHRGDIKPALNLPAR